MPNIKFNYLYRDGSNYKRYDYVVLANPDSIVLSELENLIKSKLIWGEWFYAEDWKLQELFLDSFDFKVDPTWHEFESIEYTDEAPNSLITLSEFMKIINDTRAL